LRLHDRRRVGVGDDKEAFGSAEYRERVGTYYDDSYRTAPPVL
jgi:hypothetical protein